MILDTSSSHPRIVATTVTGSDGSFRFVVAPGDYYLRGGGKSQFIHLDMGSQVEVDLSLPTS